MAHPERVVAGLEAVGLRGTIGTWGWDIEEGPFAAPTDEVLDRQRAVVERWPAGGLVTGWVTLVGHDLASDALLAGAADLARKLGTGMTMHLSPTSSDPERYLARTGRRPVVHLEHLGVLGPALAAGPRGVARRRGARPRAGERHGDRLLPVGLPPARPGGHPRRAPRRARRAWRAGRPRVRRVERRRCRRHPAGGGGRRRHRPRREDRPRALRRALAFELATIAGAEAIGMAEQIGSLEPGKQADLVVHRADGWGWSPRGDVGLQLVWGTDGRSVRDVVIAGRPVVRDGGCVTVDARASWRAAATRSTTSFAAPGSRFRTAGRTSTPADAGGRGSMVDMMAGDAVRPLGRRHPRQHASGSHHGPRARVDHHSAGGSSTCPRRRHQPVQRDVNADGERRSSDKRCRTRNNVGSWRRSSTTRWATEVGNTRNRGALRRWITGSSIDGSRRRLASITSTCTRSTADPLDADRGDDRRPHRPRARRQDPLRGHVTFRPRSWSRPAGGGRRHVNGPRTEQPPSSIFAARRACTSCRARRVSAPSARSPRSRRPAKTGAYAADAERFGGRRPTPSTSTLYVRKFDAVARLGTIAAEVGAALADGVGVDLLSTVRTVPPHRRAHRGAARCAARRGAGRAVRRRRPRRHRRRRRPGMTTSTPRCGCRPATCPPPPPYLVRPSHY